MTGSQNRGGDASGATTGPSEETHRTLSDEITSRQRAFITAAAEIEAQDAASAGEVGYVSPLLADFGLPLRNPGQVSRWERTNGNQLLIMRPAALADKDGNITDGVPFGLYPRLILAHLATEAKTKQSPVVSVGKSLNAFMAHLGLHKDGRSRRGFIDQVARLTGAAVTIKHIKGREVYRTDNYTIASSVSLWLGDDERPVDEIAPDVTTSDRLIWPETVHLSAEFYANLDSHAVPVDGDGLLRVADPARVRHGQRDRDPLGTARQPVRVAAFPRAPVQGGVPAGAGREGAPVVPGREVRGREERAGAVPVPDARADHQAPPQEARRPAREQRPGEQGSDAQAEAGQVEGEGLVRRARPMGAVHGLRGRPQGRWGAVMDERYMTPAGRAELYAELVERELGRPAPNLPAADDGAASSERLATVTAINTKTRKTTTTAHHGREEAA